MLLNLKLEYLNTQLSRKNFGKYEKLPAKIGKVVYNTKVNPIYANTI